MDSIQEGIKKLNIDSESEKLCINRNQKSVLSSVFGASESMWVFCSLGRSGTNFEETLMMSEKGYFNRRRLLKKAAGIAAGAIAFPHVVSPLALGKADSAAASNRIVMGCIGMGGQGTSNMRAFMGHQDVRVPAVCDVRAERPPKSQGYC
jgi:hypothetical protein